MEILSEWKPIPHEDYVAETGQLYDVMTRDGKIFRGYAMDWGFCEPDEETPIQDKGHLPVQFRTVDEKNPCEDLPDRGCPCLYVEPCKDSCSCINSFSSAGCNRCATYGSLEQRTHKAKHLAKAIDQYIASLQE